MSWKHAQQKDRYVREATRLGVRSRSYFKLQQIDQKNRIFDKGHKVVDLGSCPGGWSQYALSKVKPSGNVVALDLLQMKNIVGVDFFQVDITSTQVAETITTALSGYSADVVLSDMAPNITGNCLVDERNYADIYQAVFDVCSKVLADDGSLVMKFFRTNESSQLKSLGDSLFGECKIQKPQSSRGTSQESYIVAKGFDKSQCVAYQSNFFRKF